MCALIFVTRGSAPLVVGNGAEGISRRMSGETGRLRRMASKAPTALMLSAVVNSRNSFPRASFPRTNMGTASGRRSQLRLSFFLGFLAMSPPLMGVADELRRVQEHATSELEYDIPHNTSPKQMSCLWSKDSLVRRTEQAGIRFNQELLLDCEAERQEYLASATSQSVSLCNSIRVPSPNESCSTSNSSHDESHLRHN